MILNPTQVKIDKDFVRVQLQIYQKSQEDCFSIPDLIDVPYYVHANLEAVRIQQSDTLRTHSSLQKYLKNQQIKEQWFMPQIEQIDSQLPINQDEGSEEEKP